MKIQISLSSTLEEKLHSLLLRLQKDKRLVRVDMAKYGSTPAISVREKDPYKGGVGQTLKALGWGASTLVGGSEYVSYMERPGKTFQVCIQEVPGAKYIIPKSRDWSE